MDLYLLTPIYNWGYSKGKVGYTSKSTRDIYQHIPPIYGLYNGCVGQYGVIFGEQLPPFELCKGYGDDVF